MWCAPAEVSGYGYDASMVGPAAERRETHPADLVTAMVDRVLEIASSWTRWDGQPVQVEPPGPGEGPRTYTPHKAVRRVADHMIDHLAEMEARLGGRPTEPDHWHGSAITTPVDLASFTDDDLDEARSRLRRLAQLFDVRMRALGDDELDRPRPGARTIRELAAHVAESIYYAESVGEL